MDIETESTEARTTDSTGRRRVQTACEACRACKIKCQPSEQPGVCRKCLDTKKECISRTGPRTRRSRKTGLRTSPDGQLKPPNSAPNTSASSTFSINFDVPAPPEPDDSFEVLRETHESLMDSLLPPVEGDDDIGFGQDHDSFISGLPTPGASSTSNSHSIEDLNGKPQFNLSSAESLLEAFHAMIPQFPCILLPQDATVPTLAASKPFLLLAILASTSGSKTLQGHTLYDAEFRKVLGLKFVAGGERNLQLLQGLLIYCAWYPFHLRPRNKQVFHYIRMIGDLIHDLDLDQDIPEYMIGDITDDRLDGIRAYLGYSYLVSAFLISWRVMKNMASNITPWTLRCCDILEKHATSDNDRVLATLTRICSINSHAADAVYESTDKSSEQKRLLLLGLETQLRELQQQLPSQISSAQSVQLSTLFIDFFLTSSSIIPAYPRSKELRNGSSLQVSPSKLCVAVAHLRRYFDCLLSLTRKNFTAFIVVDWCRVVLGVVVALRMCFFVPECPGFDYIWARSELQLSQFLTKFCEDESPFTPASNKVDVCSASRVVMSVVKDKFEKRLEAAAREEAARASGIRCPMLDGSLEQYLPLWDVDLTAMPHPMPPMGNNAGSTSAATGAPMNPGRQAIFHDLWATMTMGWANEDE
ncbi:unnamed protein product [Clonostachys solani]|uniref:Zn(2)-C6 fungal-type domain-containing protein n=1 Tax=Clonostachys solani TaxID=160281 RepID=A0A9N9W0D2_9HYPO|nr:unnamed protein product [Clonostachys solani]